MVTVGESGRCNFRVYLPNAGCVELLGSFSEWKRAKCIEFDADVSARGWWSSCAELGPGEHEFCYLVDGSLWMPDYAAGGIRRNSDGRWISLLFVPHISVITITTESNAEPARAPVGMGAGREAGGESASPAHVGGTRRGRAERVFSRG